MIKLFKKIRRKIWDWRMNRLLRLYSDYWNVVCVYTEVMNDYRDEVVASNYKDLRAYKHMVEYMEKSSEWEKESDKILKKIRKLDAKINGQK